MSTVDTNMWAMDIWNSNTEFSDYLVEMKD